VSKRCILSFTASGHGVGGALCIDGQIVSATSLERLTRRKYDILLPISRVDLQTFGWGANPKSYEENIDLPFDLEGDYSSVDFRELEDFQLLLSYLLETGGITLSDVDVVAYSYRHNESARRFFKTMNPSVEFIVPEHHFSHAAQAFLPSPFEKAAILILDGQGVPLSRTNGDQLSGCLAYGRGDSIEVLHELPVKYSLGDMYWQLTKICGFKTNEECKTMGLASYGNSHYYERLKAMLKFEKTEYNPRDIKGIIRREFRPEKYVYSLGRYRKFFQTFGRREKGEPLTEKHENLAHAGQKILEDVMVYLAEWLHERTGSRNLCIAGGVGLNCVANYKVLERSQFDNMFIYPNAGDNGVAVGQALYVHTILHGNPREYRATHDYLGKEYSPEEVRRAVEKHRNRNQIEITEYKNLNDLYEAMAGAIGAGKITSWWQGRSEYGPRALGNRSILADPRNKDMKDILNFRVKFRESFRPFTPSVLAERAGEFFTLDIESPFMLLAPYVKPGTADIIPAVTHVDNTARVQTVTRNVNERYYDLISTFARHTGVPMLLNTSFNIAGEPIVETPEDAVKCFLSTDIDILGIDRYLMKKTRSSG